MCSSMRNRLPAALLTACLALAVLFVCAAPAVARDAPAPLPEIALAELPV